MSRPQHLVVVNDSPFEILATPPSQSCFDANGSLRSNIFEIGKKWRNVHLLLESDAGYDQPVAGDINVYLYHTKDMSVSYYTTVSVSEDMRCDIALPDTMIGAQFIYLSRAEEYPYLVIQKMPDFTNLDYTIGLTLVGDTFENGAGEAEDPGNWNFVDVDTTGMTIDSISYDGPNQVTVTLDPGATPADGTFTFQATATALTGTLMTRLFTLESDDVAASITSESVPENVILAQIIHEGHSSI